MMYNPYNYMNGTGQINGLTSPYSVSQPIQNLQQPLQQSLQSSGLIKVTGIDGAKAYQMPPNGITALFDSNDDIFYVKTTDGAGFPTIKTYKFTAIEETAKQEVSVNDFISRAEFEQFKTEVMNNGKQSISKRTNGKQDKPSNDE